nr:TonB-dependent receptor [Vibrio fluminensis]
MSAISGGVTAEEIEQQYAETDVIVVQGQKIARSIQETKESVAVLTDDDIEQYEIRDLNEAFAVTANVYDMGSGEVFGIRGVSQNSASTGGGTGEMGSLYVDGVAYTGYASRFMNKEVWDVEQIEVLRGPQSTNVGRNALIGAVVVTSKRPELGYYDAALRLGAGSYGREVVDVMFNAPIGENAAFRLTGQFHESDGFIESDVFNTDRYDARTNNNVRAQLLLEPSDRWSLNLTAQYVETEKGEDIYFVDPDNGVPLDNRKSFDDVRADEDYQGFTAAIDFTYYLTPQWTLNSITSYLDGEYDRIDDADRIPNLTGNQISRNVKDRNIAQELRFNYDSENVQGVTGVYLTEINQKISTNRLELYSLHSLLAAQVPAAFLPLYQDIVQADTDSFYDKTIQNMAFFTEWDYTFAPKWTASIGFRYDYEKSEIAPSSQERSIVGGLALPAVPALQPVNDYLSSLVGTTTQPLQDTSYFAFLPQVGLSYQINFDHSVSAFYKRGYRSGGTDIDATGETHSFEPEYLDNFELAFRSEWLDGDLVTNANLYYGKWKDQQVDICIGSGTQVCYTENAGKSEIYGLELESFYQVNHDLSLFANLGIARTEFKDYVGAEGDFSGNQFAYSPEYTAAIGASYFITERIYTTASANYMSEMFGDQENRDEFKTDARTIYNLTAGYMGDNFKLDAYVKNLTDKFYIQGNYEGTLGDQTIRAGAPREFGVNLTVFM